MMNTLDLTILIDTLQNPAPTKDDFTKDFEDENGEGTNFDENSYNQATYAWEIEASQRHHDLTQASEHGHLNHSPETAILLALAESTTKVEKAEKHRTELLALAIHSVGVSIRRASEASGLHAKTVEKRANESASLETVIAYKERELESLRKRIAEAGE